MRFAGPIAVLLFIFSLLPRPATAKTYPSLSLTSGVLFSSETRSDRSVLGGLKGGYWLVGKNPRDSLGIEGVLLRGNKDDLYLLRGDLLYPVLRKGEWRSFLTIGIGGIFRESDNAAMLAFGGALAWQADTPYALRLDIRHQRELAAEQETGWEIALNLSYEFGFQPKPKPKPRPDADADGVPDGNDRCANTPKGLAVNLRGCPKNPPDTDGDRIPDYLDRCLGTPAGVNVADDGCPPDADADGIPDEADRCPNNPPGLPVDEQGCVKISR